MTTEAKFFTIITDYGHIRKLMDKNLGPQISVSYLDDVHRRWKKIGKLVAKGN